MSLWFSIFICFLTWICQETFEFGAKPEVIRLAINLQVALFALALSFACCFQLPFLKLSPEYFPYDEEVGDTAYQLVEAMKLEIGSARNTPFTPIEGISGRVHAKGMTIMTFLSVEKNMASLPLPTATKVY